MTDYTLPPLPDILWLTAKEESAATAYGRQCAEAARAPLLAANAALSARIAELEELVREMDEHEGAEGWSAGLREKIKTVRKESGDA